LLETVGREFVTQPIDLYAGAQYRSEYLAKNPNHNVPLLEIEFTDGKALAMIESGAMVQWLADAAPDKRLAPPPGPSRARADYLQMLHFGATHVDMMLWQVRIHEHILPQAERDPRTAARYRAKLRNEAAPQIAGRLERDPFICGAAFTAADIVIGHDVFWARGYGEMQEEVFTRYLARLAERPAFGEAFSDLADFTLAPPERPAGAPQRPSPFTG
jgi:glutathione S-transferase